MPRRRKVPATGPARKGLVPKLPSYAVGGGGSLARDAVARATEEGADFERSRRFYEENFETLFRTYAGEYIALIGSDVVDSDTDFGHLAERVYTKYGVKDIFMPKVERERTVRISGPRLG